MITEVNLSKKVESFLKKAVSKDKTRESLLAINANGRLEACDGYRYHTVKTQLISIYGDLLEGRFNLDSGIAKRVEEVTNNFPDMTGIIPSIVNPVVITGDQTAYVSVNAKYLAEALAGMDNGPDTMVTLLIKSPRDPIQVFGMVDGIEAYALVMPMWNKELTPPKHTNDDKSPARAFLWAGKGNLEVAVYP